MRIGASIAVALLALPIACAALAQGDADVAFSDVPARRSADGTSVEADAVGMPDERLPMVEARCVAARRAGERRAERMLHAYVDRALRTGHPSPRVVAALHGVVDDSARVTGVRSLVDCGAVVRVAVPFSSLSAAARGAGLTFP